MVERSAEYTVPEVRAATVAAWDVWEHVEGLTLDQTRAAYERRLADLGLVPPMASVIDMTTRRLHSGSTATLAEGVTIRSTEMRSQITGRREIADRIRQQVRDRSAGRTYTEVRADLAAAAAAAGLPDTSPGTLSVWARDITPWTWSERFTEARSAVAAVRVAVDRHQLLRSSQASSDGQRNPRLPDGAVGVGGGPLVATRVLLDDRGSAVLGELSSRLRPDGSPMRVPVWLTADDTPTGPVLVHLGDDVVGRLENNRANTARALVQSARTRHRRLSDRGLLTGTGTRTDPYVLRLRLPRTPDTPVDIV